MGKVVKGDVKQVTSNKKPLQVLDTLAQSGTTDADHYPTLPIKVVYGTGSDQNCKST